MQAGERQPEVLVVGAGPAGLVAGIVLARYNVPVTIVDKRPALGGLPRALVISTRTMEILRSWGLEDNVRSGTADVIPRGWVTDTLSSGEGVEIPLGYPTAHEATAISPTSPAWAPQDHLEPILLAYLGSYPSADICFGTELAELDQNDGQVIATLRDRAGLTREIRPRFVIGADGAHSTVRAKLAIEMEGPDDLAEFHRVLFRAPLARLVRTPHYGINVITTPEATGVLAPSGRHDRWGLAREWTPGQERLPDHDGDQLRRMIVSATGIRDLSVELDGVSSFTFAAQIAQRYRAGRGFVVGDAAHRMTPRGGTGMNTAIHDAYDLAWKLAWVLLGWATPELLDSYETERRPAGLHNVRRSSSPSGARMEVEEALPYDLNGRVIHRWLSDCPARTSTLDLLGEGVTVFSQKDGSDWSAVIDDLHARAPFVSHALRSETARDLGIGPGSALLLRPDGQELGRWSTPADARRRGRRPLQLL